MNLNLTIKKMNFKKSKNTKSKSSSCSSPSSYSQTVHHELFFFIIFSPSPQHHHPHLEINLIPLYHPNLLRQHHRCPTPSHILLPLWSNLTTAKLENWNKLKPRKLEQNPSSLQTQIGTNQNHPTPLSNPEI